jgi:hypothetical protein
MSHMSQQIILVGVATMKLMTEGIFTENATIIAIENCSFPSSSAIEIATTKTKSAQRETKESRRY